MVKFTEDNGWFDLNEKVIDKVYAIAETYCSEDEIVYVGIKGVEKEYLLATNKNLYIYKEGLFTGNLFGNSIFSLSYDGISAIQLHKQFLGAGYIEIIGGGVQNKQELSYWSGKSSKKPSNMENCLGFAGGADTYYNPAVIRIRELISDYLHGGVSNQVNTEKKDKFEEIKKFKELLDMGIITQEEFDKKKNELLEI